MHAHAEDLRAEVRDDALVEAVLEDWRRAPLDERRRALCAFAEKLTLEPAKMGPEDVERLRAAGFDDRAILDACEVAAYFNYINRIADALGVDPEDFMPPRGESAPGGRPNEGDDR